MAQPPVAQLSEGQTWINELGSMMKITSYNQETGVFGGTYHSPDAGGDPIVRSLTGQKNTEANTLGWTVNWKRTSPEVKYSVTTWSGQLQLNEDKKNYDILTTWVLTTQTTPKENWGSTNVGFDHFTPNLPSE